MAELSQPERAELHRLRAEVARLQAAPARRGAARPARWSLASVLLVLSTVVWVGAAVGVFARTELLDTDRYVETVAPLARDPAVQQAVADRLTDELVTRLELEDLLQQLADALAAQGAPEALGGLVGPVAGGIRSFVHEQVQMVLASDQFAQVWDTANRIAHDDLDALLTSGQGEFLSVDAGTLYLDLGAVITVVKQRLLDAGLTLVERLPDFTVTVPLVATSKLPELQGWVRLLDAAAWVLPLAALGLLAGAVAAAPDRRRALLIGAVGYGVGMLVLIGAVAAGRGYYLDHLPPAVRSRDAAAAIYDTLLRFLVTGAQTLAVIAAIVAIGCWLVGPGRGATALRRAGGGLLDRGAAGIDRAGLPLGRVPGLAATHRRAAEAVLVAGALAILVIWRHPGMSGTLWLTAGLAAAVCLVELAARLDRTAPAPAATSG